MIDSTIMNRSVGVAALGLLLAGCPPREQPAGDGLAAYVLLTAPASGPRAGQTVPFARVITATGARCPELVAEDGQRTATTPRRNPHGFPVQVCEAVYPFERSLSVATTGVRLPAVTREPRRVAVLGDTGCKPKDQGGCPTLDPSLWPLPAFARQAASAGPDLVLHMGDYNYRGTPGRYQPKQATGSGETLWVYDAGDGAPPEARCQIDGPYYSQNASDSADPDSWESWRLDFFAPAAELLAAAPWAFARGNHELCSRAGPGWMYFLAPSSDLPEGGGEQQSCPDQEGHGAALPHLAFVEPYTVELGELAVTVIDSANACDELPNFVDRYAKQFAAIGLTATATSHWIMGHRPIWGADALSTDAGYDCAGQPAPGPQQPYTVVNRTLECALANDAGEELLANLDLALAGHMHRFQWLDFSYKVSRPPMLIVGNSGVHLNANPPDGDFAQVVDGVGAAGFGRNRFGWVELLLDDHGVWRAEVVARDPSEWAGLVPRCGTPGALGQPLCLRG